MKPKSQSTPSRTELVCRKHEILQCTVPCCEPTCDNDCSKASCPVEIVRRKTCVCEPGYVRHKGKCIHPSRCPPKPPAPCECGPNEELLPSPPSCEPTCTDDCSSTVYHTRYVDQPTCVCRKGYRRHNGKCIRVDQCPTCGPYATLRPHAPCCEPTCINDCSNVICISESYGEPACVCQDGYVKHNATCIRKETCPNHKPTSYLTYAPETVTESPNVVYPSHPASSYRNEHSDHYAEYHTSHSAGCNCHRNPFPHTIRYDKPTVGCDCGRNPCPLTVRGSKPTVPTPTPTVQTPKPVVKPVAPYLLPLPTGCGCGQNPCPHIAQPAPPTGCGCGRSPCPHVAQPVPPTGCGCGQSPCPHIAQHPLPTGCGCGQSPCPHSVEPRPPVSYYHAASASTQQDQPYYSIPALKQCSSSIANQQKPAVYCPTPGLGHPIRPTVAPCEKHTPKPHYPESTYNNQAKDPHVLSPYQSVPLYTVTTPPPTTTPVTVAYTQSPQYEHPFYHHGDQVVNVPYQYVPHQYKSTVNEVHKDQCYLPLPATISQVPEPVDVVYRQPPSPPCFSYRL